MPVYGQAVGSQARQAAERNAARRVANCLRWPHGAGGATLETQSGRERTTGGSAMPLRKPLNLRPSAGCLAGLAVALSAWAASGVAGELDLAFARRDLDVAACATYIDGHATPATEEDLLAVLGLSQAQSFNGWSAGAVAGREGDESSGATFAYRVAFRRPVRLGSLLLAGTPANVAILKASAAGPGDPADSEAWQSLEPTSLSGGRLFTLPEPAETRAVLVVERRREGRSTQRVLRVLARRLYNVAPLGYAYAASEYSVPNSSTAFPATNVLDGRGAWQSAGKDNTGRIPAPPINELNPTWFMLTWSQPQALCGLWLEGNLERVELDAFVGAGDVNPRVGHEDEWRPIRETRDRAGYGRWIEFGPIETRGLRLRILKTRDEPQVATLTGLHALVDLKEGPVPAGDALAAAARPPTQFSYVTEDDGLVTLVVDSPDGRRVRNLFARDAEPAGFHTAAWDLLDEQGRVVPPGTYRWHGIVLPPLELRYRGTVYPNIANYAPENSPWLNGASGPGGWLADHTPPVGVCTTGERAFLSAYVAESGVSFIECDLEGRKQWGYHSFAAWTGPRFLAADERTVYVGSTVLNTSTDNIWAVDIQSKQVRPLLTLVPAASRKRGMQGLAAHGGRLAISIRASDDWLANAAAAEDVDPLACQPVYPEKRQARVANEIVPDPRRDFLKLFRLIDPPPGGETGQSLTYLAPQRSDDPRQHVVLAFQRPVPIGSVVLPVPQTEEFHLRLSTLAPDAPFPPEPENESYWRPFEEYGSRPWDVVPAPEGTVTQALRITFVRGAAGDADPLADLLAGSGDEPVDPLDVDTIGDEPRDTGLDDFGTERGRWQGQLEGLKLLRRRFRSVASDAAVRVSSGEVFPDGTWDAQRSEPLTEDDPGIYLMEWDEPQSLRGLAIREIDGRRTKIDVFAGPADAEIPLAGSDGWEEIAQYEQGRRDVGNGYGLGVMNPDARYVDGYVDFGRDVRTRAVRLRVVEQWSDRGQAGCMGIRRDLGGNQLDARRCRVFGVAPVTSIGGESPLDPAAHHRIEIYDAGDGRLIAETPLERPGEVVYDAQGELHAISGESVVRVDLDAGRHDVIVADLKKPIDLAFDSSGNLYVFDAAADRCQVRVYDRSGNYLRSIGTAGGFVAGSWDPTRLSREVTSIAIDQRDQIWIVENQYWPKRITVWSTAGELLREHLGNTAYGGGGTIDPQRPTRMIYGPLEFELDPATGRSQLKALTWLPGWGAGEVPIRLESRTYLVTRPQFSEMQCGVVYLHEDDQLRPVAAMGLAEAFDPLKRPATWAALGSPDYTQQTFLWCDADADGEVEAGEVQLRDRPAHVYGLTAFNRDLGVQQQSIRYVVREVLPSGVPQYDVQEYPRLTDRTLYRLDDGNFFRQGDAPTVPNALLSPTGEVLWTYPQEGSGVQALGTAQPWHPGQIVAQFGIVGHETAHAGELGEFLVVHGNTGAWNITTADGLVVGPIFRDLRDPAVQPWSMRAHELGLDLSDATSGQEHFSGYLCRTADDRYLAVAGHNHASVVEVIGLDRARRIEGQIEVTQDDVRAAEEWQRQQDQQRVYARSPVLDVYRLAEPPALDGKLEDWGPAAATIANTAEFRIAYDDERLYLAWRVQGVGPLRNTGEQWDRLFKSGAAVDVQLGVDPDAAEDRQAPVEGDVRLLLTYAGDEPTAVLYRAVVPGTPADQAWRVVSPVDEVSFDEVQVLDNVRIVADRGNNGYTLEAAVPLAALGLEPTDDLRLRLDWGLLTTGPDGHEVLRRIYWANPVTAVVADAPSEARLHPNLWGHARFHAGEAPSLDDRLDATLDGDCPQPEDLDDLLDKVDP
jgi:hypothetical protein